MKNGQEVIDDSGKSTDQKWERGNEFAEDTIRAIQEAIRLVHDQEAEIEFMGDSATKRHVLIVKRRDNGEIIFETDKESVISLFFKDKDN